MEKLDSKFTPFIFCF